MTLKLISMAINLQSLGHVSRVYIDRDRVDHCSSWERGHCTLENSGRQERRQLEEARQGGALS